MSPKALILAASLFAGGTVAALPAAAAGSEGNAQAPQLPVRVQVIFNLIDVNGDGFIDQTEIAALQRAIFAAVDTDGDAKLSKEEFAKVTPGQRAGRFARFMQHQGPRGGQMGPSFHRGGRDGGPRGDRHGQMQPQDLQQGPGQGFGPGGMMPPAQMGQAEPAEDGLFGGPEQVFAVLDLDGDGVISVEEFAAGGPRQPGSPE